MRNQEGFVSTGAFFTSEVVPFFTVPREAASSHRSGAKSLNTYLREALSDTRRHKEKYPMQGCSSPWRHLKAQWAERVLMCRENSKLAATLMVQVVNFADYKGTFAQPKTMSLHKMKAKKMVVRKVSNASPVVSNLCCASTICLCN